MGLLPDVHNLLLGQAIDFRVDLLMTKNTKKHGHSISPQMYCFFQNECNLTGSVHFHDSVHYEINMHASFFQQKLLP